MQKNETIDVRPILAQGGCPFDDVVEAAFKMNFGDRLTLVAPFDPKPIYEALSGIGFDFEDKKETDGDYSVQFRFTPLPDREVDRELDLTGLEPPEPMMRASEALADMHARQVLKIHTRFKPMHLLNKLDPLACIHESIELGDGTWQTWLLVRGVEKCAH